MTLQKYLTLAIALCITAFSSVFAAPQITTIGAEETLGESGRLPTIATDKLNQPHVAADVSGQCRFLYFAKIGGGWRNLSPEGLFRADNQSPQFYNPHLEINANDVGVLSGVMWYQHGMGFQLFSNMSTNPQLGASATFRERYIETGNGGYNQKLLPIGNISMDPKQTDRFVAYYGNGGLYSVEGINASGQFTGTITAKGSVGGALQGGEKNYFWISKNTEGASIWHGCTETWYQNNTMGNPVQWAEEPSSTNANGSDHTYPGMCSDNKYPTMAYLAADYNRGGDSGIAYNVFNGNAMIFGASPRKLDAAGTSGSARFEPQLYPANNGGAWIIYSDINSGQLRLSYIGFGGTVTQQTAFNASGIAGTRPDICVDKEGNLHIVYINGAIRYRKLLTAGDSRLEAVSPIGRTSNSSPILQWSATESSSFSVVMKDYNGVEVLNRTVSLSQGQVTDGIFSYDPKLSLSVGRYTWSIADPSTGDTSSDAEFTVIPQAPIPLSPAHGARSDLNRPIFTWEPSAGATWYRILVMEYGSGGVVAADEWVKGSTSYQLPNALDNGAYSWWVLSMSINGTVMSDWSTTSTFSIGVPGMATPVTPKNVGLSMSNQLTFSWLPAEANLNDAFFTWYNLVVKDANGEQVNPTGIGSDWFTENPSVSGTVQTDGDLLLTDVTFSSILRPGEYTWQLQAVDGQGSGFWADAASFSVGRHITPGTIGGVIGEGQELTESMPTFRWLPESWASNYDLIMIYNQNDSSRNGFIRNLDMQWGTSYTPGNPLAAGDYIWWVRPIHVANGWQGSWGVGATFQIVE